MSAAELEQLFARLDKRFGPPPAPKEPTLEELATCMEAIEEVERRFGGAS